MDPEHGHLRDNGIDIQVRNTGDTVAVVTGIRFHVRETTQLQPCRLIGGDQLSVSKIYDVTAWDLGHAFGLDAWWCTPSAGERELTRRAKNLMAALPFDDLDPEWPLPTQSGHSCQPRKGPQAMIDNYGVRFLLAVESLAYMLAAWGWWRVWRQPTAPRIG